MIKLWSFHLFMCDALVKPEDMTSARYQAAYDKYLNVWLRQEDWGFDGIFWAEHHFSTFLLAPSPHLMVATVAARTTNLRLGVLGSVLPMHDGRRFAEECGMLDYLTHGRFEPGIAPGSGDREPVMAGVPSEKIRPRYQSAAELLLKSVAEPYVTHKDEFSNLDHVPIVPRLRKGTPIWATVMSPESARWAAQRGFRICTAWLPLPVVCAVADAYRQAAQDAGRPVDPQMLGLRRRVFVAPTDSEAQDLAAAAADTMLSASEVEGGVFETSDPNIRAIFNNPDDFVIGSPKTVAEQLIEQCQAGGFGHVAAWTDCKLFEQADFVRCHELLGREVAPALHAAAVPAQRAA